MRFQAKLIVIYAVFMLVAAITIGTLFYSYSVNEYTDKELDRIDSLSTQIMNQMLEIVDLMKYRTDTLLADPRTLNSLRILSQQSDYSEIYIREAREILQNSLITDSIMSKFHRVIIFNNRGDYISTKNVIASRLKNTIAWDEIPGIELAKQSKGKPVLLGAHEDVWGRDDNTQVFSLLRAIQGSGMGYIEVQQSIEELEKFIRLSDNNIEVIIYANENDAIYTFNSDLNDLTYESFSKGVITTTEKEEKLISNTKANLYGLSVIVMKPMSVIEEENRYILTLVIAVVALFYLISLGFIVVTSVFLTRPIRILRNVMENTEINTNDCDVVVDVPNDEIMALSITYQKVLERLKNTLEEEKQILVLQMEAQYDLLQAQVNPHFLFNVLNVISNKGLINNDESICEICGDLADMLRYSTNVKEKYATIEEEIDYVKQYLNILSTRFEHKLEFSVSCDSAIKSKRIPKITIQQFVENSINHGFKNTSKIMKVEIIGNITDEGWSIIIKDNGCGFSQLIIDQFNQQFEDIKEKISSLACNVELELGGMGLANTFSRMYLLYGNRFGFIIKNESEGAHIEIFVKDLGVDESV